jgi:hypothetical protein
VIDMQRFRLEQSESELYTSHSGLALLGRCIALSGLEAAVEELPLRHGIAHRDVVKSYLGLLALGKSDFEAVQNMRADAFFKAALGIGRVPSAERLRQRLDGSAELLLERVDSAQVAFLRAAEVPVTALWTGHVGLDLDVFPLDNSGTKKEGVGRTYAGVDGYAPIGVYLGEQGWCLACELRAGTHHSQKEFGEVLERVLPRARALTALPLLMRLDSGHDALENRMRLDAEGVDFITQVEPPQGVPGAVAALRRAGRALGGVGVPPPGQARGHLHGLPGQPL